MKRGKVVALVGAQLGSEGKGVVAHYMSADFDISIRTGAPNAGHSFVHQSKLYKMQSIPCAWTNPDCLLVIGPGALVNLQILQAEIDMLTRDGVDDLNYRLVIDSAAGILEQRHHAAEGGVDGALHARIGSTGEGVGAARVDRLSRDPERFRLAQHCPELAGLKVRVEDSTTLVRDMVSSGKRALLEGTQGCGLSLIHGAWPHVTTQDTNAAQFAADAGLPPQWVSDVVLVARTYPIRVAGPSGPMHRELTWENMSERVGKKVVEMTTVTKKIRRIGEWDEPLMRKAVWLNDPAWIALTFMDYLSPEDEGKVKFESLSPKAQQFIYYVESTFSVFVRLIGTAWDPAKGWTCIDRAPTLNLR